MTAQLEAALRTALAGSVLGGAASGVATLAELGQPRNAVEILHLIWDFFRDKLSQRDTVRYTDHLGAGDDLAWDCYLPFVTARVEAAADAMAGNELRRALKEPPLVFYSPERGLFAQSRAQAFRPHGLTSIDVAAFRAALQHLPIPIITMPWYHARRASCLAFIAHEAGHIVADDLGLNDEMKAKIAALPLAGEAARWQEWLPEVFGDVFGTAALGTAYVDALAVFLAGGLSVVRGERVAAGQEYPPRAIRLALCGAALAAQGIVPYPHWLDAYGEHLSTYAADAALVARALLDSPFPSLKGRTIRGVLGWSADEECLASTLADALLTGAVPSVPFTVRRWIAAAALAERRDPAGYQAREVDAKVVAGIVARRASGLRWQAADSLRRSLPVDESIRDEESVGGGDDLAAIDRSAGRDLATMLGLLP